MHHLLNGDIMLHQQTYVQKILKIFLINKANSLSAPIIGRSKTNEDPYHPCEEEEEEIVD